MDMTLKQHRFVRHLTQAELAKALNCSTVALRAWERGTSTPRPSVRRRLDEFFGEAVDWPLPEARA